MRGFTQYVLGEPLDGLAWHERESLSPGRRAPNLKLRLEQQLAQGYAMASDPEPARAGRSLRCKDEDRSGFTPDSTSRQFEW